MATEISPTLQALLLEQADAFKQDVTVGLVEMDALTFYRWAADRQYKDAARFANATRTERLNRKCGRCGQEDVLTVKVGPYTACEPCAAIISN